MLIDSHCHLDFDSLSGDLDGVLARMETAGVSGCVTISTRVGQFDKVCAIADSFDNVWCSVGTHPHNAAEEKHVGSADLVKLAQHPKCVAIGEAGLDYHYDNAPHADQKAGFIAHIQAARESGLPLIIHARSADDDVAAILREQMEEGGFSFILHCFSSGLELAKTGLELGGYISFSGIITFKNADELRQIAQLVPAERLLVETDAPYLAPEPHRGKTNEPAFVRHTGEKLAEIRGVSFASLGEQTTRNFARLFAKTGLEAQ